MSREDSPEGTMQGLHCPRERPELGSYGGYHVCPFCYNGAMENGGAPCGHCGFNIPAYRDDDYDGPTRTI